MVHSLRESHLRLSVSFLLCCTVFIRAESDAERVRGQWLCRYVRELSAKQYGKNVIGFIEGRYNFTGPMTIDQLEYPSGCAEQMEWRGTEIRPRQRVVALLIVVLPPYFIPSYWSICGSRCFVIRISRRFGVFKD